MNPAATKGFLRRSNCVAAGVLIGGLLLAWLSWRWSPSAEHLADEARLALEAGDLPKAERLARRAVERSPRSTPALAAAGEVMLRLRDAEGALEFYSRLETEAGDAAVAGLAAVADLLSRSGRLAEAEACFERLLALDPDQSAARSQYAAILVLQGRRRASAVHLFELVRRGRADVEELALLGNLEQMFDSLDVVERFLLAAPEDPLLRLGAARIAMRKNEVSRAAELLRQATAAAPHQLEAQAALGRVLVDLGSADEFLQWHAALPDEADENPDVWAVRGQWAQRESDTEGALRCYWEAVRRDPNHWKANYELARILVSRGDEERARPYLQRAERLNSLADAVKQILLDPTRVDFMLKAARLTESLGRPWEAWAWYDHALRLRPRMHFVRLHRDRLRGKLSRNPPQTLASANPAGLVDLSSNPLPRWGRRPAPEPAEAGSALAARRAEPAPVRFTNDASALGLDFAYENGNDPGQPGLRTWQSFGGGVAVLDFDGDGWPDLYFTQGGDRPPLSGPQSAGNRLYRNRGGRRFEDVTLAAGAGDAGYGQGVTVGDFDNDGFPDLYVANVGRNALYRNNGDGTFSDVTESAGLSTAVWTSSCLLADLNGDGLPDIYDVNYLAGARLFEHQCYDEELREYRSCPPTEFPSEQDRLLINLGDGRFQDVTTVSGVVAAQGKGLGIVAADFEGTGRLDLFVANDTTPNFFFANGTPQAGETPRFVEEAVVRGCAYDTEGRGQACMGVAADDADGDGRLDLYITNFYNEYNTLYLMQSAGLFIDASSASGLKQPSVKQLGWGTQFLDAELDGWPDLVVVNGHFDDFRGKGLPFRMPPQYFSNLGEGRFLELPASSLGDYFQQDWLGRGLARLDWNRDGREDFAVSHLEDPAALLTNRTPPAGRFLALALRGVASGRDAIGATVRVTCGERTRVRQLTAGDGYYASNERQLVFGLGDVPRVDEVHVRWPSGTEQTFQDLPVDAHLVLVEGRRPLRLPP